MSVVITPWRYGQDSSRTHLFWRKNRTTLFAPLMWTPDPIQNNWKFVRFCRSLTWSRWNVDHKNTAEKSIVSALEAFSRKIYIHTFIYMYTYMYTCIFICIHTQMCTCIYISIYICMYTYICTYIHIYVHPGRCKTSSVGQSAGLWIPRSSVRFWQVPKKSRTQIYMDLSYIDPQARVLNFW